MNLISQDAEICPLRLQELMHCTGCWDCDTQHKQPQVRIEMYHMLGGRGPFRHGSTTPRNAFTTHGENWYNCQPIETTSQLHRSAAHTQHLQGFHLKECMTCEYVKKFRVIQIVAATLRGLQEMHARLGRAPHPNIAYHTNSLTSPYVVPSKTMYLIHASIIPSRIPPTKKALYSPRLLERTCRKRYLQCHLRLSIQLIWSDLL